VDGGIGSRQEPVSFATGVSWFSHHTVSSPFVRQMGHSSIQVTVDLYGHLIPGG